MDSGNVGDNTRVDGLVSMGPRSSNMYLMPVLFLGAQTLSPVALQGQSFVQPSDILNASPNAQVLPDVVIRASDGGSFAVHSQKLIATTLNGFGGLYTDRTGHTANQLATFDVKETFEVLRVIVFTIYSLSCNAHKPSLECLRAALLGLNDYGITPLQQHIFRGSPLFTTLLLEADAHPFEIYAIAGQHKLEDLAIDSPAKTTHLSIIACPADYAETMGVCYLQRIYSLHDVRERHVKEMFHIEPKWHPQKSHCPNHKQEVTRVEYMVVCGRLMRHAAGGFDLNIRR